MSFSFFVLFARFNVLLLEGFACLLFHPTLGSELTLANLVTLFAQALTQIILYENYIVFELRTYGQIVSFRHKISVISDHLRFEEAEGGNQFLEIEIHFFLRRSQPAWNLWNLPMHAKVQQKSDPSFHYRAVSQYSLLFCIIGKIIISLQHETFCFLNISHPIQRISNPPSYAFGECLGMFVRLLFWRLVYYRLCVGNEGDITSWSAV